MGPICPLDGPLGPGKEIMYAPSGPRPLAGRAVAWRRRVHSVPPSQIVEDTQPRRRERVSFRQVPSAGRPRIRALSKLPPSRRPQNQSDLCRSRQAAGLTPARRPPGDGPCLTRPAQVGIARPRGPSRASSLHKLRAGVAHGMQSRNLRTTAVCSHMPPRCQGTRQATLSPGPRRQA